jgi:hypothetical protein
MVGRVMKAMLRGVKADVTNIRGERRVSYGDPLCVKNFDFNVNGKLGTTLLAPFTTSINRTTGVASISVPPFVPTDSLSVPLGATHFKLRAAGAEVDFDNETSVSDVAESGFLLIDSVPTSAMRLDVQVSANSTLPIYQVLGLHFYQVVNGVHYAMNNERFDAVKVVGAEV